MARKLESDKILFGAVVILVLFGILMVYSASAVMAAQRYGSSYYFAARQLIFAAAGFLLLVVLMNLDYRRLGSPRVVFPAVGLELVLLVGALASGTNHNVHRWFRLGALSFEPSEFAKLALVLFLAYFLDLRRGQVNDAAHTLAPLGLLTGLTVALVLKEPDLGTSLAILFVAAAMLFVAGLRLTYFGAAALAAVPAFYLLVYRVPYQWKRIQAFLDPNQDPLGSGFQALQAKIAVAVGGINGVGLMEGKQKLFYLPEPHNDFIFAVIGEELGLAGALFVVALFAVILWRGLRAAKRCQDGFGRLLAVGLTALLVGQALVNMSVVLSLFPTKGIPLPFVSYGGSSLLMELMAVGVLLNISQHAT
ncbi:MAG TPA: putative lipid II flippase FtsW [Terriglobia bacterium]|nr:putative lipid II flippase FtsW [Terriglobia bacterium]